MPSSVEGDVIARTGSKEDSTRANILNGGPNAKIPKLKVSAIDLASALISRRAKSQ